MKMICVPVLKNLLPTKGETVNYPPVKVHGLGLLHSLKEKT